MSFCCIRWCGKNSRSSTYKTDGITFHRFPKEPSFKEKWIKLTKRENWFPSIYSVVCSRHFTEDCFIMMKNSRRLLDTAVPTLSLPITADADTSQSGSSNSMKSNPDPLSLSPPSSPKTSKIKDNTCQLEMPLQIDSPVEKRLNQYLLVLSDKMPQNNMQMNPSSVSGSTFILVSTTDSLSTTPATPKTSKERIDAVQLDTQVDSPVRQKCTPDTLSSQFDTKAKIDKNRLCRRIIELTNKMAQKNRQLKNLREQNRYYKKVIAMSNSKRTRRKESNKLGKCRRNKKSVVPARNIKLCENSEK